MELAGHSHLAQVALPFQSWCFLYEQQPHSSSGHGRDPGILKSPLEHGHARWSYLKVSDRPSDV